MITGSFPEKGPGHLMLAKVLPNGQLYFMEEVILESFPDSLRGRDIVVEEKKKPRRH